MGSRRVEPFSDRLNFSDGRQGASGMERGAVCDEITARAVANDCLPGLTSLPVLGPWATSRLSAVIVLFYCVWGVLLFVGAAAYVRHRRFRAAIEESRHLAAAPLDMLDASLPDGVGISFANLSYWAPNGAALLHSVSGYAKPKEVIALMGPSGSGKTTVLDLLANQEHTRRGHIEGTSNINGFPRTVGTVGTYFEQRMGYMPQLAEGFAAVLTVRENLAYAAELRLPGNLSLHQRMEHACSMIHSLGLDAQADVVVGGLSGGGISEGQKRKLMLGITLIKLPEIMRSRRAHLRTRHLRTGRALADSPIQCQWEMCDRRHSSAARGAVRFIDKLLLLFDGHPAFFGPPLDGSEFMTSLSTHLRK